MTSSPIRFGIVGAAHYHSLHWGNAANRNPDVDFVGLWDDIEARGRKLSDALGIPFFADVEELLDRCDAIGVTSETQGHPDLVEAACQAGVHTLVEKPMARNLQECAQIIRSLADSNITYMQSFPKRYDDAHRRFVDVVRGGRLGTVTMVRIRHGNDLMLTPTKDGGGWYADPVAAGGGALIDEGVHGADLLNWLLGYPTSVTALASTNGASGGGETHAIALFDYPSGAIGELATSHAFAGGDASVEAYGTLGVAILSGVDLASRDLASAPYLKVANHGDTTFTSIDIVPGFLSGKSAYQGKSVDEFISTLITGVRPPVTLEDGWRAVAMIEGAYQSISTGAKALLPVSLPE